MEKYQVNIGLKNGKEFSYFEYSDKNRKEIFDEILNKMNGTWLSFIDIQGVCQYWVDKDEIASIGISLTFEEISNHSNELSEKDKLIKQ